MLIHTYVLYFRILAAAGATNLLLVTFLIPVSAILLGALVLGEMLLPRHFVGCRRSKSSTLVLQTERIPAWIS